ncbi:zona pellucida-binding protein 2-like [Huso huso]|uniref:Zona pellucida-binding protein 2-like n=1 Tax=Huso huso TaxID=61971 RepID=A0ABR0YCR6_HUSHU
MSCECHSLVKVLHLGAQLDNTIFGRTTTPVTVYVKVRHNSPRLICMTEELAKREVMDPFFLWTGPDGRNIKDNSQVNLTNTGVLILNHKFQGSLSGVFTCTLNYRSMKNEKEKFVVLKFLVYGYRDPDFQYRFRSRFIAGDCRDGANNYFFDNLTVALKQLVAKLTCRILNPQFECHVMKEPGAGLQTNLFITFTGTCMNLSAFGLILHVYSAVDPYGKGWELICIPYHHDCEDETNNRAKMAQDLVQIFFEKQASILNQYSGKMPLIYYMNGSLTSERIDSCRPGYGKNNEMHPNCTECCVVCEPGTYSLDNSVKCVPCKSTEVRIYGATAC